MRFPAFSVLAATAGVMLVAPSASALTLLEAIDAAEARVPEIRSSQKQVDVMKAREEIAGRPGYPSLTLDTGGGYQNSNILGRGPAQQWRRDLGARVSHHLIDWRRYANAGEAAQRRTQAVELDAALARDRVAFEVAEAYLNVIRARAVLKLTEENLDTHRRLVNIAKERVDAGKLAKPRLTELRARIAPLELEAFDQQADLDKALATLGTLVGDARDLKLPAELPDDVRPAQDAERLLAETSRDHPAVMRAVSVHAAATKSLDAARAGWLPMLDADVSTRYLGDADGIVGVQWDNQAMFRLRWGALGEPVAAQVKEAEASLAVAEADRAQILQQIELDVRKSMATLQTLRAKQPILAEYEQVAKFSMQTGMEYIKKTSRFATDLLALADLTNVRYHSSQNVFNNRIDRQIAEFRLLQATGRLWPTLHKVYQK